MKLIGVRHVVRDAMLSLNRDTLLHVARYLSVPNYIRWSKTCRSLHALRADDADYLFRRLKLPQVPLREILRHLPLTRIFSNLNDLVAAGRVLSTLQLDRDGTPSAMFRITSCDFSVLVHPEPPQWRYEVKFGRTTMWVATGPGSDVVRNIYELIATGRVDQLPVEVQSRSLAFTLGQWLRVELIPLPIR